VLDDPLRTRDPVCELGRELAVNLAVLGFFGWLMVQAEKDSPKTIDPAIQLCRVVTK
jgi:hypothetical protein